MHKGFKSTACMDKNCVGCSATPPIISSNIIRDLGAAFCNISLDELTEEKLNNPPKQKKAKKVTKRKASDPSTSKNGAAGTADARSSRNRVGCYYVVFSLSFVKTVSYE